MKGYSLERPVPERTKAAIDRYVIDKVPANGFVMSVLANDLKGAFRSADRNNLEHMKEIVHYIIWNIPSTCQGSYEAVDKWLEG